MKRIEILKQDLASLRKELKQVQDNQVNMLNELYDIEDIDELGEKIEDLTRDFEHQSEELFKEIIYINKELLKEATSHLWEEAKKKGVVINA